MMVVRPQQRHTGQHPCRVCGGGDRDPRGKGRRCHGFTSEDGLRVHCAREEMAGGLPPDAAGLYSHLIGGYCKCGAEHAPKPASPTSSTRARAGRIVATYDYRSANGDLLYQVMRYDPKGFSQRRPNGKDGWITNLNGVRRVLYRLPELLSRPDEIVVAPEGEKDVDRLTAEGFLATTNPMGAGKWRDEYSKDLRGRRVVVLPDNDSPGLNHSQAVAKSLRGVDAVVAVVRLPGSEPGWDVSAWLDAGHTVEELRDLVAAAPEGPQSPAEGAQSDQVSAFSSREHLRESGYRLIPLADVTAEQVDWFWKGYIPFGMLTGLYGDPGVGKSTIAVDLAARATTGRTMPDGSPGMGPTNVIILSAEDPFAEVIRPRFDAAGADIARVSTVTMEMDDAERTTRPLVIPDDLDRLEAAIRELDAKLVIVDVLMAYLSGEVNSYRDQDVRRALMPLQALAERTGAAILLIGHPNKNGQQSPIYRVGGSIGIVGTYRACLVAAPAPEDPSLLVLATLKMNLAPTPPALSYRIRDAQGTGVVTWEGISRHTVATLFANGRTDGRGEALRDAVEFLQDVLRDGPIRSTVVEEAASAEAISMATLRRAKKKLKVEAVKVGQPGKSGHWVWGLAYEGDHQETEGAHFGEVNVFGPDQVQDQESPIWQSWAGGGHAPAFRADGSIYCEKCHPATVGWPGGSVATPGLAD
jgi:putative DNA primase/helicase